MIIKNRNGQIRSGWIILLVLAAYYVIPPLITVLIVKGIIQLLTATGNYNALTGEMSALANWMDQVFLPAFSQLLPETITILFVILTWRFLMKHPVREMGLTSLNKGKKEGLAGMLFGIVSCTLVVAVLLLTGQARIASWKAEFGIQHFLWIMVIAFAAFREELLSRSLLMSVLRRTGSLYFIVLIPAAIFGSFHLTNPNVTLISEVNIILIGLQFSYMFIKSGNIWMCIGYHFTWNILQGIVYGLPISGLTLPAIFKVEFITDNMVNGGRFGIEGGIVTTAVILAGFLFVKYYYRNSRYDFIANKEKELRTN